MLRKRLLLCQTVRRTEQIIPCIIMIIWRLQNAAHCIKNKIVRERLIQISPQRRICFRILGNILRRKIYPHRHPDHRPRKSSRTMEIHQIFPMIGAVYHGLQIQIVTGIFINLFQHIISIPNRCVISIFLLIVPFRCDKLIFCRIPSIIPVMASFQMNNNKIVPFSGDFFPGKAEYAHPVRRSDLSTACLRKPFLPEPPSNFLWMAPDW